MIFMEFRVKGGIILWMVVHCFVSFHSLLRTPFPTDVLRILGLGDIQLCIHQSHPHSTQHDPQQAPSITSQSHFPLDIQDQLYSI